MHLCMKFMGEQLMNNNESIGICLIDRIDDIECKIDMIWGKLIISDISNAMELISRLFEDLDGLITQIGRFKGIDISEFLSQIEQLEVAMNSNDYMFEADMLKYEIKPILDIWKHKLDLATEIYSN